MIDSNWRPNLTGDVAPVHKGITLTPKFWEPIEYGNILEDVECGIIIQQVNAQGVMGSGFAKAVRDKYPFVWDTYSSHVLPNQPDKGKSYLGKVIYCQVKPGLFIANLVGQQFYGREKRQYTSYDAVTDGLIKIANFARDNQVSRIHYPTIGCGLGGASWNIINAVIQEVFSDIPHTLWYQKGELPK